MQRVNYEIEMERTLRVLEREGKRPRLLLHVCCAPCSSSVLERLSGHFQITVFFDNPNITEEGEFRKRADELRRFLREMPGCGDVRYEEAPFDPDPYYQAVRGHEDDPEGGERCRICFLLRLSRTGEKAAAEGYDYFTTTLSVSPLKNAAVLNETGKAVSEICGVPYLFSDFKKKDGFLRSVELAGEYGLYRQDYCGCVFSKKERNAKIGAL